MARRLIVGCGYLGLRVARLWRHAGDEVVAVTRSADRAGRLEQEGLRPVIADVTQPESLRALPDCDTVLHAVGYDRAAAPSKRQVYVDGLQSVLRQIEGRCGRLIHISSTSVYGQQDGQTVDEDSVCEPTEDSGCICLDAERLVRNSSLPSAMILRLSGIYGPDRLLSRMETLRTSQPLAGRAEAWLNLIHVDDAARAVLAAAERIADSRTADRSLWLISDDLPVPRRDYYSLLAQLCGAPAPAFDEQSTARHSHGLNKRCCNRRMKDDLGVQLQFPSISQGLPHAVQSSGDLSMPPGAINGKQSLPVL